MIANEKEFDARLDRLGELYEEGKDCLNSFIPEYNDVQYQIRLFEILREMRDLAAVSLKANHEIKDN